MADFNIILAALTLFTAGLISPGPNFAMVSKLAMAHSRRAGIEATAAIALVTIVYSGIAMFGLSALLDRTPWLSQIVQGLGGGYLLYLGLSAWRTAGPAAKTKHFTSGFRTGLLVAASNPKGIAFFFGIYSAVIPPSTPTSTKVIIILAAMPIEVAWFVFVSFALSSPKAVAAYARFGRGFERLFGAFLALIGARLILDLL